MLRAFEVSGLNDRFACDLTFHEDLNIITGKNGSGKTTLLKLLWYLMSGNLERILPEMSFTSLKLTTDTFSLMLERRPTKGIDKYQVEFIGGESNITREVTLEGPGRVDYLEALNRRIAPLSGASLFLPTFRRIEGGFNTSRTVGRRVARYTGPSSNLEVALASLSETISVLEHQFIASISTQDVVALLTKKFAEVSDQANSLHSALTASIIDRISLYKRGFHRDGSTELADANSVLQDIASRVETVTKQREELLRPFSVLSDLVSTIFQYKAIALTEGITLGEAADAIASDKLSAGEKQFLSFLCYNAFYQNTSIFIDEPELSLHVDWQRLLFPTLLEQGTGNQFIVATHSPFIYSKYPDKELVLDLDRGGF